MAEKTIIAASLDDSELKKSIDGLVSYYKDSLGKMGKATDEAILGLQTKLAKLGTTKIDSSGSSDGGSSKRAKAQNAETDAIEKTNAAIDKRIQKGGELKMTLDQEALEMQKLIAAQNKMFYARTMKIPTDQYDLQIAKLERIQSMLQSYRRGTDSYTPSQVANMEREEQRLLQLINEANKAQSYQGAMQRGEVQDLGTFIDLYGRANAERLRAIDLENQKRHAAEMEKSKTAENLAFQERIDAAREARNKAQSVRKQETSELQGAIAGLLNVERGEIVMADATTSAYKKLTAYLSNLQSAYRQLDKAGMDASHGKMLADEIQRVSRAINVMQKTMSRPVSLKAAMGLSEKTMDDITYKIQQLRAYQGGLNLTDPKQVGEISQVDAEIKKLNNTLNKYMVDTKRVTDANTALGRSWNYMKNRLAFYFTVGASTAFVKNLIEIRGQYELLERSIGILIDSAQRGSQIFAELNAMAIKSPFTTMELGAAAKQLVAYDVAAKDVVDTTRRLADMAAAVGIPIERLTYALGQIKSYGFLNSRDARMFSNAGIPLVKQLADYYTELEGRMVSVGDVYDRIKKKTIDYADVVQVVNNMTDEGGKFFNFQEKAADTLKVKIANLALAWNNMLNEIGKDSNGILAGGLGAAKQLFEHWRDINNMMVSVVTTIGLVKAAQLSYLLLTSKTLTVVRSLAILQEVIGKKATMNIASLAKSFLNLTNPMALLNAAMVALSIAIGKVVLDFYDLKKANEEFSQSIVDSADENIKSIDKFFEDYRKQFDNLESLNKSDLSKLWERLQEEIEKTTRNAEDYVDVLNKITDVSERIELGKSVLDQSQRIQEELKRMADRGIFSLGGGFANDSAAKDIKQYNEGLNVLLKTYGSLEEAEKRLSGNTYANLLDSYKNRRSEAEKEIQGLVNMLDQVDTNAILGDSDNTEVQLANIRAFATAWRDAFLATEEGAKIGAEGQALLNSYLDQWITKQAEANWLIQDENGLFDAQRAQIERNRTAWEEFFRHLTREERKTIDAAIKTNQLGGDEVKKIWDNVAARMAEKSTTSYTLIQQQIAELRNTPDIVINVVYRERRENLDEQQEAYTKKYLTPSYMGKTPEEFLKEEKKLREKYGRFMKKGDEDNVEWEKRLGQEYQNNEKNIKSLTDQIEKSANMSDVDKKAKQGELDTLKAQQVILKEIEKDQGFDYNQFNKGNKGSKKDPMLDTLKQTTDLIKKLQGEYDTLTKAGENSGTALANIQTRYRRTLALLNQDLRGFGLPELKLDIIKGKDPNAVLGYLTNISNILSDKGLSTLERQKALEVVIQEFSVKAETYNLDKITKGLNSELSKLKDEYELAVELDANPEMGDLFASFMGIDKNALPRTFEEAVRRAQQGIDKILSEFKSNEKIDIASMLDKESFDKWVKDSALKMDGDLVKAVEQFRQYLHKVQVDENKKITQEWDNLIGKYGDLQAKMLKIYKDNVKEQLNIIRKFGDYGNETEALDLVNKINISEDPAEIARLQKELAAIMQDVVNRNPKALKLSTAIDNAGKAQIAKATWEDFKESDLYTMTFEDMSRNSTRAIQLIIEKLETLKDKVKEDPASMKALMKSLKDANKELESRSSTVTIVNAFKDYRKSVSEVAKAKEELVTADADVKVAEQGLNSAKESKDVNSIADATQRLEDAREKLAKAQEKLAKAENKQKASQEKLKAGFNVLSAELQNLQGLLSSVSKIFSAMGDDETAEAINAINEGFTIMTTVIGGVVAAMVLLETTTPWLLAIAAALGVVVGLVSFLSGQSDKKITKQIKESEAAVKDLELAYKSLEHTAEGFYGSTVIGAKEALKANKELQLAELQRQLRLEQSRSSKKRDEDRIRDLRGQIMDLQHEISKATMEIINDLLGISSHEDFFQSLISDMRKAFQEGEDMMKVFDEKWGEMIDSMVDKQILGQILSQWVKNLEKGAESIVEQYTAESSQRKNDLSQRKLDMQTMDAGDLSEYLYDNNREYFNELLRRLGQGEVGDFKNKWERMNYFNKNWDTGLAQKIADLYYADLDAQMAQLDDEIANRSIDATDALIDYYTMKGEEFKEKYGEKLYAWMQEHVKQNADEAQTSALQAGISAITETTANALEAYMNGMSQQVYLQSDLITQIRDAVVAIDSDVQTSTQAQMLLQLQNNYIIMQSMHAMMEGWTTPSGQGIRVELLS